MKVDGIQKYSFNTYLYRWEPDPEGEFYLDDDVDAAMKEKEADIAMLKAELRHWEGSRDGVLECLDKNEYEKIQIEDDNSALREQNSAMNESLVKLREVLKKCLDWLSEYTDSELVAEVKSALKESEVKDEQITELKNKLSASILRETVLRDKWMKENLDLAAQNECLPPPP